MSKVRIRRTRRRHIKNKLNLTSKPWQTISFMILFGITIIMLLILILKIYFPDSYMMYGEENYTDYDDMECFDRGHKRINTYEQICCYKHPLVKTTDYSENKTWQTTECFKKTNITQLK